MKINHIKSGFGGQLSLRTWSTRLVRKGIRFSKSEQMHKIVIGLVINIRFFGRVDLIT
ncbi:IS1 family transposase [Breznakiellaceae bacterium SP9]